MSCYAKKSNPIRGFINSREPKTREGIIPDQRTVGLSTPVTLHGEHYTKNMSNKHLKKMGTFCL